MPGDTLVVKTPVYEGPLEMLLELVEKRKLLINDISLAAVTDEYIARVSALPELPVGETADFVSLAATLLLIKSRSLLPNLEISGEEEQNIKELEYRLALYQLMRDASRTLGKTLENGRPLYEGVAVEPPPLYAPDASATPANLLAAARRLIEEFPLAAAALPKVAVRKVISLEEMIEQLAARISSAMKLSFREFSGLGRTQPAERYTIVVGFLALLELVKQGKVRATQHGQHGDITLEHDSIATPSYE